ncbi:MAG: hypothetical protein ACR2PT_19935 [Endozoicomonas sp.]
MRRKALRIRPVLALTALMPLGFIALDTPAATQGSLGKTSTGSFSITLVVHPVLQAQIETGNDDLNEVAETLSVDQPSDFCVSGRGMNHFSLKPIDQFSGSHGYTLTYQPGPEILPVPIDSVTENKFTISGNCQNFPGQLSVKILPDPNKPARLSGKVGLVIQAE